MLGQLDKSIGEKNQSKNMQNYQEVTFTLGPTMGGPEIVKMKFSKYCQYIHHLKAYWFLKKGRKVKIVSRAAFGQKSALSDRSDSQKNLMKFGS